jgi:hypothetical protein
MYYRLSRSEGYEYDLTPNFKNSLRSNKDNMSQLSAMKLEEDLTLDRILNNINRILEGLEH